MADFAKIAGEIFQILRSFDYTVKMFDENSQETSEAEEARYFLDPNKNRMVAIKDNDDNSSVDLSYGPSTHANDIKGLSTALRVAASKYAMTFSASQSMKEITPKRSRAATVTERKRDSRKMMTSLTEGMYGTSRSSYLRMENARMIVRHSKRIDDSLIGARGRCVEHIFIENASGERLLFPSNHIGPARAMTQHINHDGTFADQVGEQIMRMTQDFANLGQASNFVGNNAMNLAEGAMAVREACRADIRNLRECFKRLARPSSYAAEAANVLERAKTLTETDQTIDETRISEIRQLLNDADLPRGVYECACRAMDRMKSNEPMTEGRMATSNEDDWTSKPTSVVNILGSKVDRTAWEAFVKGKLNLKGVAPGETIDIGLGKGEDYGVPEWYSEKGGHSHYAELCYKLGAIVPRVEDDSLANFLQRVLTGIEDYSETGFGPNRAPPVGWKPNKNDPKDSWRTYLHNMVKIAKHALKAAKIPLEPNLASQNSVVKEYMAWIDRFDPHRVLSEDYGIGGMEPFAAPSGFTDPAQEAKDDFVRDFDADEFAKSPEVEEMLDGRDEHNPHENRLTRDEIMQALHGYLERHVQTYSPYFDDGFVDESDDVADAVYDQAVEALQQRGFVVDQHHNEENAHDDLDDLEEGLLSMSDILIPKPDQGDSLAHQVTKAVVKNPNTKKTQRPTADYISQLTVLGNRTTGIDGQAY